MTLLTIFTICYAFLCFASHPVHTPKNAAVYWIALLLINFVEMVFSRSASISLFWSVSYIRSGAILTPYRHTRSVAKPLWLQIKPISMEHVATSQMCKNNCSWFCKLC